VYRLAVAVLCALAPLGLLAAPAPKPRPWFTGWDKPVDPVGDCTFDRKGDQLTVTVPGAGHGLDVEKARLDVPHLLRDVEGDFVLQVRIGADFRPAELEGKDACRAAGIVLMDGTRGLDVIEWAAWGEPSEPGTERSFRVRGRMVMWGLDGGPPGKPTHLRLERSGDCLEAWCSPDGKEWSLPITWERSLPRKLKVGVFAESTAPGVFKPTFDQFQLSRPGK
jgi:hypothetical protein